MKWMTCTTTCSLDSMTLYSTSRIIVVFVRVLDSMTFLLRERRVHIMPSSDVEVAAITRHLS